jgi:hypothetical protein
MALVALWQTLPLDSAGRSAVRHARIAPQSRQLESMISFFIRHAGCART